MRARVQSVFDRVDEAQLSASAAAGSVLLSVESVAPYLIVGGTAQLHGGNALVESENVIYDAVDPVALTVHLSAATLNDWTDETVLSPIPQAINRFADVLLEDAGDDPQPLLVRIPQVFASQLNLGTRAKSLGEWVHIEQSGDEWIFVDFIHERPDVELGTAAIVAGDPNGAHAELSGDGLVFYDEDGNITGELSGDFSTSGFSELYVGELTSPSVVMKQGDNIIMYVDPTRGSDENNGLAPTSVLDSFTRTVSNGWGTSDTGQVYVRDSGTASVFSCNGASAVVVPINSTAHQTMRATLWGGVSSEAYYEIQGNQATPGANSLQGVMLNMVGADITGYKLGFNIAASGVMTEIIYSIVAGTETTVASTTGPTWSTSKTWCVRAQAVRDMIFDPTGNTTRLRLRVWDKATTEPTTWDLDVTNTVNIQQYAGAYGFDFRMGGTGTPVMTWTIDNLSVTEMAYNPNTGNWDTPLSLIGAPKQTLQSAIDDIPKYLDDSCIVEIVGSSGDTYYEAVVVDGFLGSGEIHLDLCGKAMSTIVGSVSIYGVRVNCYISGGAIEEDGSGDVNCTIKGLNSAWLFIERCQVNSNSLKPSNMRLTACQAFVQNCVFNGATARTVAAEQQSVVRIGDCTGTATNSYVSNASVLFIDGNRPSGNAPSSTNNGQIFGTATAVSGGGGGSTKVTKYFQSKKSNSYHTTFGWNGGGAGQDSLFQSGVYKGLWFYDSASIRSALSGKTIDSISIYVKRTNDIGSSGSQHIQFWRHNYDTQPGGNPTFTNPASGGSVKWNEAKWMTLPVAYANALRDNTMKGVGVFQDDYLALVGRIAMADSGKLKITYH